MRPKWTGLDTVIGHLRTLIKDPSSPPWVRLAAIDRLQNDLRGLRIVSEYVDLQESLANGGGPACLRLRVAVNDVQLATLQPFLVDASLLDKLEATISSAYRDMLTLRDLADPLFVEECKEALERIAGLLGYDNVYSFQA